jgi:Killing trait
MMEESSMPKPGRRGEKATKRPAGGQDRSQAAEAGGPEPEQAQADRGSRRDRAWAEFCGKLGAQGPCLDPAGLLSQVMLMAACGPASAMFAANHADALMFYNAVANQQKTNILGMSVTAKCVRYMFEVGQTDDDEDDLEDLEPLLGNE